MDDELLICPFCGHEFFAADSLCHHGCPLSPICHLHRCPSCDYEFPGRPRSVSWLRRLVHRLSGEHADVCRQTAADGLRTVGDLTSGERARVLRLAGEKASRRNALAVFGLVPGSEIELVERQPAYVIRVGETELALDAEIAREILIEPAA